LPLYWLTPLKVNRLNEKMTRSICLANAFSSRIDVPDAEENHLSQINRNTTIRELPVSTLAFAIYPHIQQSAWHICTT
jgi:hypothetical protein